LQHFIIPRPTRGGREASQSEPTSYVHPFPSPQGLGVPGTPPLFFRPWLAQVIMRFDFPPVRSVRVPLFQRGRRINPYTLPAPFGLPCSPAWFPVAPLPPEGPPFNGIPPVVDHFPWGLQRSPVGRYCPFPSSLFKTPWQPSPCSCKIYCEEDPSHSCR